MRAYLYGRLELSYVPQDPYTVTANPMQSKGLAGRQGYNAQVSDSLLIQRSKLPFTTCTSYLEVPVQSQDFTWDGAFLLRNLGGFWESEMAHARFSIFPFLSVTLHSK